MLMKTCWSDAQAASVGFVDLTGHLKAMRIKQDRVN